MKKFLIILVALIFCVGGFLLYFYRQGYPAVISGDVEPAGETQPEPEPEPEPIYNPLTGLEIPEAIHSRVVVVSIDNLKPARPQSGLSQADWVYEVPAEGGITRYQALFYSQRPDTIGPVRSTRPYIVDICRGWQGLYVHCGWSEDARRYLQSGVVDYLNEITYSQYFHRDKSRKAPHNLYTGMDSIYSFLQDKGLAQEQEPRAFSFYPAGAAIPGQAAETVVFAYPTVTNRYEYDAAEGLYYRYVNDKEQRDANNDVWISCANILVQKVTSQVLDSVGRLKIDMTAGGEAMLFTGGKVQTGRWKREGLDSETLFVDEQGRELKLTPGQTWVQICDQAAEIRYSAPTPPETAGSEESAGAQ
ncbi:MAG: DUF3048 domain-containing protein [Firmicutes bacterium]|nr:DUF3048 domain-containing protein [Bacillota bacterium]